MRKEHRGLELSEGILYKKMRINFEALVTYVTYSLGTWGILEWGYSLHEKIYLKSVFVPIDFDKKPGIPRKRKYKEIPKEIADELNRKNERIDEMNWILYDLK